MTGEKDLLSKDNVSEFKYVKENLVRIEKTISYGERHLLLKEYLEKLNSLMQRRILSKVEKSQLIEFSTEVFKYSDGVSVDYALLTKVLKNAKRHATQIGDARSEAILYFQLAKTVWVLGRQEESRKLCLKGLNAVDSLNDKALAEYAGRYLIMYHTLRGEPFKALDIYRKIRTSLDANADTFVLSVIIPHVAFNAAFMGQFRLGKRLLINGLLTAQIHGYFYAEHILQANLGMLLSVSGEIKQARMYLSAVINSKEKSNYNFSRYLAERNMSYLLFAEDNLKASYEQMQFANANARKNGLATDIYFVPWILDLLWAFHRAGFKAIPGFEYSNEINRALKGGNNILKGTAYRLQALDIRLNKISAETQLGMLKKSKRLLSRVSAEIELAKTNIEIARAHLRNENIQLAKPLIREAWKTYESSATSLFPEDLHQFVDLGSELPKEKPIWPTYDRLMDLLEQLPVPIALNDLYGRMVSIACSFFMAEQGGLFRFNEKAMAFELESALNMTMPFSKEAYGKVVLELIDRAVQEQTVIFRTLAKDNTGSATVLCIPITTKDSKLVLFLKSYSTMEIFYEFPPRHSQQFSTHISRLISLIINLIEAHEEEYRKNLGQATLSSSSASTKLLYCSDTMKEVMYMANLASESDASVVILGETGVGKELLAFYIHDQSKRRHMPFVALELSGLPESLIESELFGYEKGAFTGATQKKSGLVELANKGTLFLDEIGDVSLPVQLKLLRIIQEKAYRRIGGREVRSSDFRLITATNKNLQSALNEGQFREDLYYRLNVITITVPPLRERKDDIIYLTTQFLNHFSRKYNKPLPDLNKKHKRCLSEYDWPGNVRELKNLMERVVVLQDHSLLNVSTVEQDPCQQPITTGVNTSPPLTMNELQIAHIRNVIKLTNGKISGKRGAANILGMKRTTLLNRMKKLGISSK